MAAPTRSSASAPASGEVSTLAELSDQAEHDQWRDRARRRTRRSGYHSGSASSQNSIADLVVERGADDRARLGSVVGNTYQGTATVGAANPTRTSLQSDYNNVLTQIDALAGDASYNGVNLLDGDDLKVVFNETGTSSLTITGVTFDAAGLGLRCCLRRWLPVRRRHRHPDQRRSTPRSPACARRLRSSVRTCRRCRPVRTSPRT